MKTFRSSISLMLVSLFTLGLAACEPEVGSDDWCAQLDEKNKGDWTANEAKEYAKNCVL